MLLACLLLVRLLLAANPGRSTLDTKKGYKTKTGSTSSVTLTLTTLTQDYPSLRRLTQGYHYQDWILGPSWWGKEHRLGEFNDNCGMHSKVDESCSKGAEHVLYSSIWAPQVD